MRDAIAVAIADARQDHEGAIGAIVLVLLIGGLYVCEEHIRAVLWMGCP